MTPQKIRENLNKPVRFKNPKLYIDGEYILTGAIYRKNTQGCYYQAELTDPKFENSVIVCDLADIEITEELQ